MSALLIGHGPPVWCLGVSLLRAESSGEFIPQQKSASATNPDEQKPKHHLRKASNHRRGQNETAVH